MLLSLATMRLRCTSVFPDRNVFSVSSAGFLLNRSDVAALCHLPHLKDIASNQNNANDALSGEPQYVHTYAGEASVSAEEKWARPRVEAAVKRERAANKLPWTEEVTMTGRCCVCHVAFVLTHRVASSTSQLRPLQLDSRKLLRCVHLPFEASVRYLTADVM